MSENIILIGFMGTGKDTIGRLLAERLNMGFIATDEMIELAESRIIKRIFEENGEDYFRKKEKWAIKAIEGLKNVVIGTGGGIVIDSENRARLKRIGKVIQLSAKPDTLKKRIIAQGKRPLIKNLSDIERLYRKRNGIYDFAQIKIDTTDNEPERIVAEIIDRLNLKKIELFKKEAKIIINARSKKYPVLIGCNITDYIPVSNNKIVIITNPLVGALYLNEIVGKLKKRKNEIDYFIIPDGEEFKNLKTVNKIYEFLFRINFQRGNVIISLGGGVITDIGGFVASTFKRGCRIIHIPTTLLCQVDAAIGGKTGIDNIYGKNLLGTFYQPELVLCDLKKLLTLPENEFLNGMAEVIKYGIISSRRLFRILQNEQLSIKNREIQTLFEIVKKCVLIKSSIIIKDETEEKGIREILNFGHTIGHLIETVTGYKTYSHGAAIAMGMVEEMQFFSKKTKEMYEVIELLKDYKLPTDVPVRIRKSIKDYIFQDKKIKGKYIRIPVFERIGRVKVKEVLCKRFF